MQTKSLVFSQALTYTCLSGMVFCAIVACSPSAAFKIIVFIWKDSLVSEAGWGMHPSRELAIPQHAGGGGEIKIASDEGYNKHTHKQRKALGEGFLHDLHQTLTFALLEAGVWILLTHHHTEDVCIQATCRKLPA